MKIALINWTTNSTYKPIGEGLTELEHDMLQIELKKNHSRSRKELRSAAKRAAVRQKIRWLLDDVVLMSKAIGVVILLISIFLITQL